MLKTFLSFALIQLTALPTLSAHDSYAQDLRYKQLTVDSDSVSLISTQELSPGYFKALFAFKIIPSNSCEENYAGAFEHSDGNYTIVYSYKLDQPCHYNAQPRIVNHVFYISIPSDAMKAIFTINGRPYTFNRIQRSYLHTLTKNHSRP